MLDSDGFHPEWGRSQHNGRTHSDDWTALRPRRPSISGATQNCDYRLAFRHREEAYDRDIFEYLLDYNKIDRLGYSDYGAIIVSPMNHSIRDMDDASSAMQEMKDHPDIYPPVIETRDSHMLKITNNSLRKALRELNTLLVA